MRNYQERKKFFYVIPKLFPNWEYPSRYALGINLDDASFRHHTEYNFVVKGKMYSISKEKAEIIGRKYKVGFGKMPHLIPKEEFIETEHYYA